MLLCSVERVERWLVRPGSRACSVPGPSSPCAFVSFFRSPPDPVPHNAPAGAEGSKLADKADVQSSRCLIMSHARHLATIHDLEDAAFGLYRGVGSLIENPPHVAVALRRAVAVVHSGALLVARAYPHPRRQLLGRIKGGGRGTDFRDDLLRRIHSWAGHLGQPFHGILMRPEQIRHLLSQLANRSEEHTSELQSPCKLVCRLLLEKKKYQSQYIIVLYYLVCHSVT